MATRPKKTIVKKKTIKQIAIGRRAKLIFLFAAPLLAFVAYPTIMVAIGGMLPTLVAFIIDSRPERYAARTVGYLNLSGVFIVCLDMWTGDHTWQAALEVLYDPLNWLIMFGTAALGWVLYFILPPVSGAYLSVSNDLKLKSLISDQEKLVKEWGNGVSRNAPAAPRAQPVEGADDADNDDPAEEKMLEKPASKPDSAVPSMSDIGSSAVP